MKKGEITEAKELYSFVLKKFPNNKKAQRGLADSSGGPQSLTEQSPPQTVINALMNLLNQGELKAVVGRVESLIGQYPKAVVLWNMLGVSSAQLGAFDQAILAFSEVLAINPKNASAHYNLGNMLKDRGQTKEAIEAYTKALELKPDYELAHNNLVASLQRQGSTQDKRHLNAIKAYGKLSIAKAEIVDAFLNQGTELRAQGKLKEALKVYNEALAIKPNYAAAYNNMGAVLREQNKMEEALGAYKKAIAIKPDYAEAYCNLGVIFQKQGELEEAIEAYRKALAIQPDYADALYNMGIALDEQGNSEEAIEAYKKAITTKPDYAEAYYNMATTFKEQRKSDEAITAYKKAIAIKPDYAEVYNNMGVALKDQSKLEEALEAYKKAIAIKPEYAEAFNNMGIIFREQGKLEEAIKAYKKANEIKPNHIDSFENLVKLPLGSLDEGILDHLTANLALVLEQIPQKSKRMFLKANLYSHKGKYEEAFTKYVGANNNKVTEIGYFRNDLQEKYGLVIDRTRKWSPNLPSHNINKLKKLFLLGPSRSGKTTLEKLLSNSPNVLPLYESTKNIPKLIENNSQAPLKFENIFYQNDEFSLAGEYEIVTSTSPETLFYIDALMDRLENSYCVLVKRDRVEIASEMFRTEYSNGNFYSYNHSWIMDYLDAYEAVWQNIIHKLPNRCIEISFESLLAKPNSVSREIGELTGVDLNSEPIENVSTRMSTTPYRKLYEQKFVKSPS
jgi:tetratricopeptide (TPR) repeat protein